MKTIQATLFAATLVAHAAIVSADDETAEAAAKRGQAALKAGHVHEACEAFAASEKLAAAVDTELSLAACYEQDGKPASAARMYRAAAGKDVKADRKKASTEKATKLEAKAPKLRFAISPAQPGTVVKVDGVEVPATEDARVDTGPHDVVATAPGFEGHANALVDREGAVLDVIVRMEPKAEPAPPPAPVAPPPAATVTPPPPSAAEAPAAADMGPPPPADTTESHSHRKTYGIVAGAVGLGALVTAVVLFESSSSKYDDVQNFCPGSVCRNDAELAMANAVQDDARTQRGFAYGLGITGVLLLGVGGYLMLAPEHESTHVSLHVDRGGAGMAYSLRF